ncbi:MAG: GFA family protein [Luteimonas sp.]
MSEPDVRSIHAGGCHCGSVRWEFVSTLGRASFVPRACDCDFCSRHRAGWISDPAGSLRIRAPGERLQRYRQGSGQAEFLLCRECGVLVAVVATCTAGRLLGAVNRNAFDARGGFADETIVSPRLLAADAKLGRWTEVWMPTELRTD